MAAVVWRRLEEPELAAAVRSTGLDDPADLAVLYTVGDAALRAATKGVPLITDDRPRLEFSAPAAYFRQAGLAREALEWLAVLLDPGAPPVATTEAVSSNALRRELLNAQLALLAGDQPAELRAYLDALEIAARLRRLSPESRETRALASLTGLE